MIELLDPRRIARDHRELWGTSGWNYGLDYPWIISQVTKAAFVLDVGCYVKPYSQLARFIAEKHGAACVGIDRKFGEEFEHYQPDEPPDVVLWASSLEHNTPEDMRRFYLRSMEMLAPGGLFIATIAISPKTHWFGQSKQTNLSEADALAIFDEQEIGGDYEDVRQAYRSDAELMKRYKTRYGYFHDGDPAFITAGVVKCSPI